MCWPAYQGILHLGRRYRVHLPHCRTGKTPSFVVGQSQVIHAMKENSGSSIATDQAERFDRYRYACRNDAFTYRQEGLKGACYYFAKCGLNACAFL